MVLPPRNGLSLCAGAGGLDMGLMLAEPGFHTRCFVEWEEYPRQAIIAAQRAGYFAPAPIWDDLRTFDGRPFRGAFDTVLAGYPCQPFSHAGQRRGADDERHLWPDVARVIREVEPEWVFIENVAGHVSLGAETVLRDLWGMGWTPAAGLFSASETGAPHERLRWFCVAHRRQERHEGREWQRQQHGVGAQSGDEGRIDMAYPNGRDASAERQQRGGQLGFQPEGGGTGADDVVHAGCSERRPLAGGGCVTDRNNAGREEAPSRPGQSGADVGHPTRLGRGEGRAEHGVRVGPDAATGSGGAMADTGGAERQGQQPGQRDTRGWQEPHGHPVLSDGAGLFPPGPGDADAWASVMRVAPDLAPAVSLGDVKRLADHCAQMVARGELAEAAAESRVCLAAHGLAHRARALRLLGNGVCPIQAAYAWRTLTAAHGLQPIDLEHDA